MVERHVMTKPSENSHNRIPSLEQQYRDMFTYVPIAAEPGSLVQPSPLDFVQSRATDSIPYTEVLVNSEDANLEPDSQRNT